MATQKTMNLLISQIEELRSELMRLQEDCICQDIDPSIKEKYNLVSREEIGIKHYILNKKLI